MADPHFSDETLKQFLFDTLPGPAREAVEREALRDPSLLESIEALEQELIFDYLEGRLNAADLRAFEVAYCSSSRRQRVEEARALVAAVSSNKSEPAKAMERERGGGGLLGMTRQFRFAFAAVGLVCVVALAAAVWRWRQTEASPERPSSGEAGVAAVVVARIRLGPGLERGAGGVAAVLREPGQASGAVVGFELSLPAASAAAAGTDPMPVSLGRVETPAEQHWTGNARRTSNRLVTVEVPARVLVRGDYVLRLMRGGLPAATYQFRVD